MAGKKTHVAWFFGCCCVSTFLTLLFALSAFQVIPTRITFPALIFEVMLVITALGTYIFFDENEVTQQMRGFRQGVLAPLVVAAIGALFFPL